MSIQKYRAIIPLLSLLSLIILVTGPLFLLDDWTKYHFSLESKKTQLIRMIGYAQFAVSVALFSSVSTLTRMFGSYRIHISIMLLFSLLTFLSSVYSIDPYASMTGAVALFAISFSLISTSLADANRLFWTYKIVSYIILFLIVLLLFYHDVDGRRVGGIPANQLGKLAFTSICLSTLLRGWARAFVGIVCLSVVFMVSSRSSMLAISIFAVAYFFLIPSKDKILIYSVVAIVIGALSAMCLFVFDSIREYILSDVLYVTDADRGISSGFTGRTVFWAEGLRQFEEAPLLGYGFQTRQFLSLGEPAQMDAHHGFVNLLLDLGIVGMALFGVVVILAIYRNLRHYQAFRSSKRVEMVALFRFRICYILSYLALWFVEPAYFNFGTAYSIIFVTCLLPVGDFVQPLRRAADDVGSEIRANAYEEKASCRP